MRTVSDSRGVWGGVRGGGGGAFGGCVAADSADCGVSDLRGVESWGVLRSVQGLDRVFAIVGEPDDSFSESFGEGIVREELLELGDSEDFFEVPHGDPWLVHVIDPELDTFGIIVEDDGGFIGDYLGGISGEHYRRPR